MKSPKMPKEDPQIAIDRERERRLSELDRTNAGMDEADRLTTELRKIYGMKTGSAYKTKAQGWAAARASGTAK
jgi:hypothetical protein